MKPISAQIRRQPQPLVVAEGLLLVLLVGVADYFTRNDISVFIFYALPILFVVWYAPERWARVTVALACTGAWAVSEMTHRSPEMPFPVFLFNTLLQLGFVMFTLVCASALKEQLDRTRAKVAQLESFYVLAEIAPVGIFRANAEGRTIYANQRWCKLTGLERERLLGQGWCESLHPDDRERLRREWGAALGANEPLRFQARFQPQAGGPFWALGHVAAEHDRHGAVTGYVGAIADVTEHRQLEREVLDIAEREQQRIGQDLHDDLCQFLAAIQYGASSLRADLKRRNAPEAAEAQELADYLKEAVVRTRNLARRIFPAQLEQAGLISALHELAHCTSRLSGIRCTFEHEPPLQVDDTVATQLYRIAQEALANALRHGKARQVTISLGGKGEKLSLCIEDDGCGIRLPVSSTGMGLRIMEYRSHMIGGTLQIEARPEGGTVVRCTFRKSPKA